MRVGGEIMLKESSTERKINLLFGNSISDSEKEFIYQRNKKSFFNFFQKNSNRYIQMILNNWFKIPNSILGEFISFFPVKDIFQIFDRTNQKELVHLIYSANQKSICEQLEKKLQDKSFDYLIFLDTTFYPREMVLEFIKKLSSEQAFSALVFHMASVEIYQLRREEMNFLLETKLQKKDFEYLPLFFNVYYGNSPLPVDFLKNAIQFLNANQAFQVFTDYRVSDSALKEYLYEQKQKEIDFVLETKLRDENFSCVSILEKNVKSLPKKFILKMFSLLNLEQVIDIIINYNVIDSSLSLKNDLYLQKIEQIDSYFLKKLQDENFDYSFLFQQKKVLPPLMIEHFIQNLNLTQVFTAYFYNISTGYKKQIFEFHQEELNDAIKKQLGEEWDYHILLEKRLSLSVFDLITDYISPQKALDFLNSKVQKNSDYIQMAYVKMYDLDSKKDWVKQMFLMLPFFRGNKKLFIENFEQVEKFLSYLDVEPSKFWQYNLSNQPIYFSQLVSVINQKGDGFKEIKDYFFQNIYQGNEIITAQVRHLTNLVENYLAYPELCYRLAHSNFSLTDPEKNKILFLFRRKEKFKGLDKPYTLEDCEKINAILKRQFFEQLKDMKKLDKNTLKDIICKMLFNDSLPLLKEKLEIYGNTENLKKLQFNNRKDEKMVEEIEAMMIYTSMIEDIIHLESKKNLKTLANNIFIYLDTILNSSFQIDNFSEKMRNLYAMESERGTTKINSFDQSIDFVLDKEKTLLYGVPVYDFSDKEYILYTHVLSSSENIKDVILGHATGEMNFICLQPISYRNQVYYFEQNNQLIFGYDNVKKENFVMSSSQNMDSNHNGSIRKNSNEVVEVIRKQRGILETSDAREGCNSETLCFREGLRPCYIILPDKRIPTEEEIDICKKYGLAFALTQKPRTSIMNPKNIPIENDMYHGNRQQMIKNLEKIKQQLFQYQESQKIQKVAIFADSHGLFEPTLAILEDARRNGITEIYSLGDNIGTGPNPKEVLELMEQYHVKSVAGNHEMYISKGVEFLEEHLSRMKCYQETLKNSNWTRNQLSREQIQNLKLYPLCRELLIGDQKILLCHSIKDLNTGKLFVNLGDYDKIFQGHVHYRKIDGNVYTLRGAGIGYQRPSEEGKAYYIVLSLKKNGDYQIKEKYVPYDVKNLRSDIVLSDLDDAGKEKIDSWVSRKER